MKKSTQEYKAANKAFMRNISKQEGVNLLDKGVYYKVIKCGESQISPSINEVVSVHYTGRFIDGREFDSSRENSYPATFRVREVIEGWQIALVNMKIGDIWEIYIPSEMGYGDKASSGIPGRSSLIFEVELITVS
ncbi:MAG: FKBP-type peptidyl-prolyl cis-trans isomerase [Rikenellaceae bacterium]